jgi:myo-inositol-1(or 4)-monophosphatase
MTNSPSPPEASNRHSPLLQTAIEASVAAGDLLRREFLRPRTIKSKGWRDIVTDADFAAQSAILDVITARFPDHAILSEERQPGVDWSASRPTWVIDPLDGTTNYAHQFPSFSVAVALVQGGELRIGVVHDPLRRVTFFAGKGQGAFAKYGRGRPHPLRVSSTADLGSTLVGVDWARDPLLRRQVLEALGRVTPDCRTVRTLGSAALGLAYVASGALDGYYHLSLQPWDVAAGALLVLEAGGTISTPSGAVWRLGHPRAVASNGLLHTVLVKTLALE